MFSAPRCYLLPPEVPVYYLLCIVCVRVPVHACVRVALRIAHLNKILRYKNTLIIIISKAADIKKEKKVACHVHA